MTRADEERLAAIAGLFARFGAGPAEALVRARTLYSMQIGYYAIEIRETRSQRMALLVDYVLAFCGEVSWAEDIADFGTRNFAG